MTPTLGNSVSGPVLMFTLAVENPGAAFATAAIPIIANPASVPNKAYFLMISPLIARSANSPVMTERSPGRLSVGEPNNFVP